MHNRIEVMEYLNPNCHVLETELAYLAERFWLITFVANGPALSLIFLCEWKVSFDV